MPQYHSDTVTFEKNIKKERFVLTQCLNNTYTFEINTKYKNATVSQ